MDKLRSICKGILPRLLVDAIQSRNPVGALQLWVGRFTRQSYAQDGEDLLVLSLLADSQTPSFYVDVGAHHPARFSNTLLFYMKGWRGINIDALPGSMALFNKWRPRDINLELGISASEGELTYYLFNDPALNTFSQSLATERSNLPGYHAIDKALVATKPLHKVFSQYVPSDTWIDFLSVDVEGMDLEVLKSNDWNHWRPSLVIAEDLEAKSLSEIGNSMTSRFLHSVGYVPCAKTRISVCYAEESRLEALPTGLHVRKMRPPTVG